MLPLAVVRSSCDGVAICMLCTSGFVDDVMFSYHGTSDWAMESSRTLCLGEVNTTSHEVVVTVGHQDNYSVWSSSSECGIGWGGVCYLLVRLAHCKCKSLMKRSSRLSSVCLSLFLSFPRQISKTKRDRREISSPL